jgi:hypothetical protein
MHRGPRQAPLLPPTPASHHITFLSPKTTTTGTTPGVLFRQHPGPWQVLRRNPLDDSDLRVVWTGDARPSLKEVAMEILPGAGRR